MDWNKIISDKRLRRSTRKTKNGDHRNEFESDLGRILFSPAIRRLHDKTQVYPLNTDDNIHTRLTHSLETFSIAHSLGINLCHEQKFVEKFDKSNNELFRIIPTLLASASVCHDIGNPPFGHFGEKFIRDFFIKYFSSNTNTIKLENEQKKEFKDFNGNAQGLRVLTKLQVLQDTFGLNLTSATLSVYLKYPLLSTEIIPNSKGYKKKMGVFQSEKDILKKIRKDTGLDKMRNPLTFLMEAADTISYLIMDIEDGFNKKYFVLPELIEYLKTNGNIDVNNLINMKFEKLKENIVQKKVNKEVTTMVTFRVLVIQELVKIAGSEFINNIEEIESGKFYGELVELDKKGLGATLRNFCDEKIFNSRELRQIELSSESVIKGLLEHFVSPIIEFDKIPDKQGFTKAEMLYVLISKSIKKLCELETGKKNLYELTHYEKLRLILDYISGMTDKFALRTFRQIQGIKIV